MINWTDKVPNVVNGTLVNRKRLMAMQGMEASTTIFNSNGSITQNFEDGTMLTTFNADGTITEKFTAKDGKIITKNTKFNTDGTITIDIV